jgi:hypothetical protein
MFSGGEIITLRLTAARHAEGVAIFARSASPRPAEPAC